MILAYIENTFKSAWLPSVDLRVNSGTVEIYTERPKRLNWLVTSALRRGRNVKFMQDGSGTLKVGYDKDPLKVYEGLRSLSLMLNHHGLPELSPIETVVIHGKGGRARICAGISMEHVKHDWIGSEKDIHRWAKDPASR